MPYIACSKLKIIPEFYDRDSDGVPKAWIARIRESMSKLTPVFNANRAVREYTEKHYLHAAQRFLDRSENKGRIGQKFCEWQQTINNKWSKIRFQKMSASSEKNQHRFEVEVYLDDLNPDDIKVVLFADDNEKMFREEMKRVRSLSGDPCTFVYQATIVSDLPSSYFTPRVEPYFPGFSIPLEAGQILWQK